MKRPYPSILLPVIVLLWMIAGLSCRKGDNDPRFTLLSRTARLKGEWKLKSGKVEITYVDPDDQLSDTYFSFEGGKFTLKYLDSAQTTFSGDYDLRITFIKEGDFSMDETLNGNRFMASGMWQFVLKSGEYRNKERIQITTDEVSAGSTYYFHPMLVEGNRSFFVIRELRKDRLVLTYLGQPFQSEKGITINYLSELIFDR